MINSADELGWPTKVAYLKEVTRSGNIQNGVFSGLVSIRSPVLSTLFYGGWCKSHVCLQDLYLFTG